MDLRTEKSKQAITQAFLALRARKPLEKITVRELCDQARINRSTFYAHYKDVYDLSDQLENDVVRTVLESIAHPETLLTDSSRFTRELFAAFGPQEQRLKILFSGNRQSLMAAKIAGALQEMVYQQHPQLREDLEFRVSLTFRIYGGYYAFAENRRLGESRVVEVIGRLTDATLP